MRGFGVSSADPPATGSWGGVGVGGRQCEPGAARTWWWLGGAALVSVLMRLRMVWSPVTVDEGGYLAIARAWGHGRVLYRDVWVDRPQGLLLLFRWWDWLSGGSTGSIRVMAMLFGVVLVLATGVAVWALVGQSAARWAALVCGVVSASPLLEAHTANGELLSGAMSASGLAVALVGWSRPRPLRWLFGSGVLAGVALSFKQSGFDGVLAVGVWLTVSALFVPARRGVALRCLVAMIGGVGCVWAMLALHGALTGWSRWWTAVAGYRLRVESGFAGARWVNLHESYPIARTVLGVSALAAAVGAGLLVYGTCVRRRPGLPRHALILVVWLVTVTGAFLIGGGFWQHYWELFAAPLSALAGVALSRLRRLGPVALILIVAPCLVASMRVFIGSSNTINARATHDNRSPTDQRVANWFVAHRNPDDNMYVLCSSAAVYADAHQDPGYPYL